MITFELEPSPDGPRPALSTPDAIHVLTPGDVRRLANEAHGVLSALAAEPSPWSLLREVRSALHIALSSTPDLREWSDSALPSDHWRALKRAQATYGRLCDVLHEPSA